MCQEVKKPNHAYFNMLVKGNEITLALLVSFLMTYPSLVIYSHIRKVLTIIQDNNLKVNGIT